MKNLKLFEQFNAPLLDKNGKPIKVGDYVEVRDVSGSYGQTKTYQGKVTKIDLQATNPITIDDEYETGSGIFSNGRAYTEHVDYEHGHKKWIVLIKKSDVNPKLAPPMKYRPTYTVRLVDYTNGKNKDKRYASDFPVVKTIKGTPAEFDAWLKKEYPTAVKDTDVIHRKLVKEFDNNWYKQYKYLEVHMSQPNASGYLITYWIDYK